MYVASGTPAHQVMTAIQAYFLLYLMHVGCMQSSPFVGKGS